MPTSTLEKIWRIIPWEILPQSAKVDFSLFLANLKPAIRTRLIADLKDLELFNHAIQLLSGHYIIDENGFLVISRDLSLTQSIIDTDQSSLPHAGALGTLLGYPKCCTTYIEKIGENQIDFAASNFNRNDLKEIFSLIDISQYLSGIALISHVPCNKECQASLNKAIELSKFIVSNRNVSKFAEWAYQVIDYFFLEHLDQPRPNFSS